MNLQAVGKHIVVQLDEEANGEITYGEILSVGDLCEIKLSMGDLAFFSKHSGQIINDKIIIHENQILATEY